MLDRAVLRFSLSRLKPAVINVLAPHGQPPSPEPLVRDVAASFQAAVVDTLVAKCIRALDATRGRALSLGGGVACNKSLRSALQAECAARQIALRIPSARLCADNAAMVAWVGARRLER